MIDIHCHILNNCDDGASTFDDTIDMCRQAEYYGINKIIATPHCLNGKDNSRDSIIEKTNQLNFYLKNEKINLIIYPGAEVHLTPDAFDEYLSKKVISLNDKDEFILLEFSFLQLPLFYDKLIFKFQARGITPIIAHIERYDYFLNKFDLIEAMHKRGILMQVTAGSIIGVFGKSIQTFTVELIKKGLVDFVASDAHGIALRKRNFQTMQDAYVKIKDLFGNKIAEELFIKNSAKIL